MKIQCETCTHQRVCGIKKQYQEAVEQGEAIKVNGAFISVDVRCKAYDKIEPVARNPMLEHFAQVTTRGQ